MATWDGWLIIDGWHVGHGADGVTLTAQLFSKSRDNAPGRGSPVPVAGPNMVPTAYRAYKVSEVDFAPVSSAGPFVIQVKARAGLGSSGAGNTGGTLLKTNSMVTGYADFHIKPAWCGLKAAPEGAKAQSLKGYDWHTGKWASAAVGDGPGQWANWLKAATGGWGVKGSPFTKMVNPRLADDTLRFLQVTVTFYAKETADGLENWGGFSGIVPVNSMPKWIAIPGGDNRWRLWDEEYHRDTEVDGSTGLFKITRVLLGIPPAAKDCSGARLQWDQNEIGQRDWDRT